MGILDKFKRKKETNEPPQQEVQGENSEAPGWDAISEAFDALYPGQENPRHYGTLIKRRLGGNDPLDGISIYDGGDYWHFITYGLSEIYEKGTDEPEISGYGMEFTFKLEKGFYEDEEAEIKGICSILQSLARITFTKGELFHAYEFVYTGQTQGIDTQMNSNITGFITIPEPKIEKIDTPNGAVDFVEFIGVTNEELLTVKEKGLSVKELYQQLGTDITSYHRDSIIKRGPE